MDHIAFMKKSWGLTDKIYRKEKIIESRWYKNKIKPWDKIFPGEIIYFKDSGLAINLKAKVKTVLQFESLNPEKVKELLITYGKEDGIEEKDFDIYYERFKDKRYCILIYIENPQKIKPFNSNKKGFGNMAAWISVENIDKFKLHPNL